MYNESWSRFPEGTTFAVTAAGANVSAVEWSDEGFYFCEVSGITTNTVIYINETVEEPSVTPTPEPEEPSVTPTPEPEEPSVTPTPEPTPEVHVHDWSGEWTIIKAATATEEGKKQTICTTEGCGQKKVAVIPATGIVEDEAVGTLEKDAEVEPEAPVEEATLNNNKEALLAAPSIFDAEEKAKVESGEASARVWLEIGKTEEEKIAPEDRQEIQDAVEDIMGANANVTFFDADLFKQVGTGEKKPITTPGINIEITIKIPTGLINSNGDVKRAYKVIRLHEGRVDVLTGTFDEATGEFTFASDLFSTYAIVYTDTPVAHTHVWANEWSHNASYHWKECVGTVGTCDITSNADKYGLNSHVYYSSTDSTCNDCGYVRSVYYPPYVPEATPTPIPTPIPTPLPTPVPTATPIPGVTIVPTMKDAFVDENGKEITSIVQAAGTEATVTIPGVTDDLSATLTWMSSDPAVASVDENGKVSLRTPGIAEITVEATLGGLTKTGTLVVLVAEAELLDDKVIRLGTSWEDIPMVRTLFVGETVDINFWGVKNWVRDDYEYFWGVSDETVATTTDIGEVTALKPGVVTMTLGLLKKDTGEYLVVKPIQIVIPEDGSDKVMLGTSKEHTFENLTLKLNERVDLNFYGVKNWKKEDYEYYWSSSEPTVAWVDKMGRITPIKTGNAVITLVLIDKKTGLPVYVVPTTITVK